jgi:hypothetical protein
MTAVWYAAAILTALCGLWLTAAALAGLTRATIRAVRRFTAWLRALPVEAQATQDADNESVALTHDTRWQELDDGFRADLIAYRGGLGLPGERRTTWTREDYQS